MFGGDFAPQGYALCDGQLIAIAQNTALFSLLGTIYGGDGITTFALPDCRGRVPIHEGNGPGLSNRNLGSRSGNESETLSPAQLPPHNHGGIAAQSGPATDTASPGKILASSVGGSAYHTGAGRGSRPGTMNPASIQDTGGGESHSNMAEALCVNFIIATVGAFPSRN